MLQVGAVGLVGAGAVSALSLAGVTVTGALWLGVLPTYRAAYLMTPSAQRLVTDAADADGVPVALRRGHFANLASPKARSHPGSRFTIALAESNRPQRTQGCG